MWQGSHFHCRVGASDFLGIVVQFHTAALRTDGICSAITGGEKTNGSKSFREEKALAGQVRQHPDFPFRSNFPKKNNCSKRAD